MNWFKQLFCRHKYLRVARCHETTIEHRDRCKVLYVDEYKVWNFIRCCDCGKVFHGEQYEKLFRTLEVPR